MPTSTQVPKQLLGYSLQFTECLSLLLDGKAGDTVSVEVFEDVGRTGSDGISLAVQVKLGQGSNPVSDSAVDLWKTFRNWIDAVNSGSLNVASTEFAIAVAFSRKGKLCDEMSTAKSPEKIAAVIALIKKKFLNQRSNVKTALPVGLKNQLSVVLAPANEAVLTKIISRFSVRRGTGDVYRSVEEKLFGLAIQKSVTELIMLYMAGWVKKEIDIAIAAGRPAQIEINEFREELTAYHIKVVQQPYLVRMAAKATESDILQHSDRCFFHQLQLVDADQELLADAVTNFLTAKANIIEFLNRGLIHSESLTEYEEELRSKWSLLRKKLELSGICSNESHFGQTLLVDCCLQDMKLQGTTVALAFTAGSFHSLADVKRVGWHPRYLELLGGTD